MGRYDNWEPASLNVILRAVVRSSRVIHSPGGPKDDVGGDGSPCQRARRRGGAAYTQDEHGTEARGLEQAIGCADQKRWRRARGWSARRRRSAPSTTPVRNSDAGLWRCKPLDSCDLSAQMGDDNAQADGDQEETAEEFHAPPESFSQVVAKAEAGDPQRQRDGADDGRRGGHPCLEERQAQADREGVDTRGGGKQDHRAAPRGIR